jgi:hypothetical protein
VTDLQVCEAMELGVQVYGRPPAPGQWVRIKQDLDREPAGGRWWRAKRWGCSLVVVRGPVTTHPAYDGMRELSGVRGHANPVPVVSADYAYPVDGSQAGVSVALHEAGHALCEVLTTHGSQAGRGYPLWARRDYQQVQAAVARREKLENHAEDWAQDYACWCLWQSGYDDRAPWFAGPAYYPVRAYMKGLLHSAGFRDFQREG